jgi:hypothetical protein
MSIDDRDLHYARPVFCSTDTQHAPPLTRIVSNPLPVSSHYLSLACSSPPLKEYSFDILIHNLEAKPKAKMVQNRCVEGLGGADKRI